MAQEDLVGAQVKHRVRLRETNFYSMDSITWTYPLKRLFIDCSDVGATFAFVQRHLVGNIIVDRLTLLLIPSFIQKKKKKVRLQWSFTQNNSMIVIAKISFFVILEDRVRAQRSDALRKMHEEFVVISFFIPSCVPFGSVGKIGCWWLTTQLVVAWVVRYLLSCLYSIIRTFGEILSLCLFFVKKCNKNVVYHVWD